MGASGGAIRMGRSFVEIFADDTRLVSGLRAAQTKLVSWGQRITGIGASIAGAAGLIGLTSISAGVIAAKQYAEVGAALDDMSQRTGASVESLSRLSFAADMSATDAATLEGGIRKMQNTLAEAAGGSKSAREALAALGVTADELKGLTPDQQFARLADGVASIEDPAKRVNAVMGVFGKSGADLVPMLAQGGDAIRALGDDAERLGVVMSTETASAMATLDDKLTVLAVSTKANAVTAFAAFAPVLSGVVDVVVQASSATAGWITRNRQLLIGVGAALAAVTAVGVAIAGVGVSLSVLGFLSGTVATVLASVGAAVAFVLSPIGLAIAAVGSLTFAFLKFTTTGQQLVAGARSTFESLRADVGAMVGGISDALAAGDIALAGEILWEGLKLKWQEGTSFLLNQWDGFKAGFSSISTDIVFGFQSLWINAWAGMETEWVKWSTFVQNTWTTVISKVMGLLAKAQNKTAEWLLWAGSKVGLVDDFEGAKQALNEEFNQRMTGQQASADAQLADTTARRDQRLKEIEAKRQAGQNDVRDGVLGARDMAGQRRNEAIARRERETNRLRREFEAKVAAARQAKENAAADVPGGSGTAADRTDVLAETRGKVAGSFSAAALGGIVGGGVMDRVAKASEATAENTRRLVRNGTGPRFAS